jgi:hypothetical protein
MTGLVDIIKDIASRHEQRMRDEPRYAITYRWMKEASKPAEASRHYDRDGYCDNPARGY